ELGRAGVALPATAPAELVVDTPRLVTLGPDHAQAAEFEHLRLFGLALGGDVLTQRQRFGTARVETALLDLLRPQQLRVAAEDDVRAAAGHVGRHGDRALPTSLGDDLRFLRMALGVEHAVRDPFLVEAPV